MRQKLTSYRRRRAQRGAVFVEAVIIVTSFVLFFVALVFFRELYVKKLQIMRLSRASVLAYSMGGCEDNAPGGWARADFPGGATASPGKADETLPTDNRGVTGSDKAQQIVKDLPGTGNDNGVLNPIGSVRLTTRVSTQTRSGLTGPLTRFQGEATSNSYVSCGDKVRDGDFGEIVDVVTKQF